MLSALLAIPLVLGLSAAAQSNTSAVVCIAGQCLQGYTNMTLGMKLSASGQATEVLLLPGSYSATTNPALLHSLLTAKDAKLSPAPGFENATEVTLPLNVGLQAGIAVYADALYGGGSTFRILADSSTGNTSAPSALPAGSLAVSPGVWVAVSAGSSNKRVVLWDSVPDLSQLSSSASGALALLDIQGSSCSPSCAGAGVCTASGTCACPPGFNGTACEACSPGFFGPNCLPCPENCDKCDEGISGSGLCLKQKVVNAPETCNCLNGSCQTDGTCICNVGWTKSDNGTSCAKCDDGFFQTSTGNCQVCQLGCDKCADTTGECLACKTGFTQNANDKTRCLAPQSTTSTGQLCPDGSFGGGSSCTPCAAECQTCSGSTSNDCVICANGKYKNKAGACVSADQDGVCAGSTMIADNIKHECDSCPSKCTKCKIPNFSVASTVNQLQCSECLPGFFLSNGTCIESCPTGTFLDAQSTCQRCDSSCGSCLGSADFCLTCAAGQLASKGKCVSTCPSGSFDASGQCIQCHPDCATCSGSSFNQCSSCPTERPVLTNGRCLPTCGKSQFFDTATSACQTCDSSCSSCSSSGPGGCLACSSANQVLKAGTCVDSKCTSNTTVVPGLGVCLSDLVIVPSVTPSGTVTGAPLPTITGINAPTIIQTTSRRLEWWQILLMALGCAFIFLVIVMCWRRRARKQRAAITKKFATAKALVPNLSWRQRFMARIFRRRQPAPGPVYLPSGPSQLNLAPVYGDEAIELLRIRNDEAARHHAEMEKMQLYGAYEYSRAGSRSSRISSIPSPTPRSGNALGLEHRPYRDSSDDLLHPHAQGQTRGQPRPTSATESSVYSHYTGEPTRVPQPRQPVRTDDLLGINLVSRFSLSTFESPHHLPPRGASPAEAYAAQVRQARIEPQQTGTSLGSKNPFRQPTL